MALLFLCLATFGVYLNRLGLYWDDWAKLLAGRLWGMNSYWAYYAEDRPYSAWTHILLTPLLGYNPFPWQIFALVMRFLTVWGIWWTLSCIWPATRRQATLAALLLAIYPVFDQQAIAVTFHQQWMQFALLSFSLGLMVKAFRSRSGFWVFTMASLLLSATQLFITEYFVGLELVRLPILWVLCGEEGQNTFRRLWKTIRIWLPYGICLSGYVIWRLFFIKLSGSDPYQATVLFQLFKQPISTLFELVKMMFVDSFFVLTGSWAQTLDIGLGLTIPGSRVLIWGAGLATALLSGFYLVKFNHKNGEEPSQSSKWFGQVLLIGVVALLAGCLQAWLTGRRVIEDVHANRYAMPAMLGASLIIMAGIEWAGRRQLHKAVMVSVLIGLAVIFQMRTLDQYSTLWKDQLNFFWQLSWRAPTLKPDTAVLNEDELFPNQGMFSSSAALNLAYPQQHNPSNTLDYWTYVMNPLFKNIGAVNHPTDVPLSTQFRTLKFKGQTPNSILVYYSPQKVDCLWVLRPDNGDNPLLADTTRSMLPASNLSQILSTPPVGDFPPKDMFGSEPSHTFCYLYQKAELARQENQTDVWLSYSQQARQNYGQDMEAFKTPHEWLTFIAGFAHAGRWQDAFNLTYQVRKIRMGEYFPYICSTWKQMVAETPDGNGKDGAYQAISKELSCQNGGVIP